MHKITALIIDDEPELCLLLKGILEIVAPEVQVMSMVHSKKVAVKILEEQSFNIVFLDVELRDGKGMEILETLEKTNFQVIFTTAWSKYALDAFQHSAVDFVLKPYSLEKVKEAVYKAMQRHCVESANSQATSVLGAFEVRNQEKRIMLNESKAIHWVRMADVVMCNANSNYTNIFLIDGTCILISKTLKYFEDTLSEYNFLRVHHSYIVNLHHIKRIDKSEGDVVILSNNLSAPISTRKREGVIQKLGMF